MTSKLTESSKILQEGKQQVKAITTAAIATPPAAPVSPRPGDVGAAVPFVLAKALSVGGLNFSDVRSVELPCSHGCLGHTSCDREPLQALELLRLDPRWLRR